MEVRLNRDIDHMRLKKGALLQYADRTLDGNYVGSYCAGGVTTIESLPCDCCDVVHRILK